MRAALFNREISPDTRALAQQLIFIALVVGIPFGIATTPAVFRDGDTSWQIASGQWILGHLSIPTTDPFSFTAAGRPWVAMEWLSQVLFGAAYNLGGFGCVAALVASAFIGLHAIIFFYLQKRVPVSAAAITLIMMDLVLAPFVMARPHVLSWPLIAGWTILLLSAAERGRPPRIWWALILVVWTNLHASFPLAIIIAATIALDGLIEARWATWREWATFGAASLVAVSLNANGLDGLLQPFRTSSLAMLTLIAEWHPSSPHSTPFFFAVLFVGLGLLIWRRIRVPIGRALLLLLLVILALAHVRHQSAFIVVAACILPPLSRGKASRPGVPKWLLASPAPLLLVRAVWPLSLPDSEANPRHLIAAVPTELRSQPVFNAYIFGGPLILAGIRPYIDGRAEIYGDAFVADYVRISDGDTDAFNRAVQRYGIRWAILPNSKKPLIDALEKSGNWHPIYSDDVGIIEVPAGSETPQRSPSFNR